MLYSIIKKLQNESKSTIKLEILREYVDYDLLKMFICRTLNPRFNYFCSEKTLLNFDTCGELELDVNNLEYITKELADRNITGDSSKLFIKKFGESLNKEHQEILKYVLLKDFRANIGEGLVSKVWRDFNWKPKYMRCSLQKDVDLSKWDWKAGVYSQTKMDGMYAAVNSKQVITRNGSVLPYDLLPVDFKQDMKQIPEGFELNGELLVYKDGKYLSRKEGNGILNSLLQGQALPEDCNLQYVVWDFECGLPYIERFTKVDTLCVNSQTFKVVDTRFVFSMEEAHKHFTDILAKGGEGTILKNPKGMWKDGTSKDQVKYKLECEIDLLCTGWIEGEGKHKGKVGALQCQSSDGKLKVNVGSGFTDKEREQEPPVNKIITVKANDIVDKRDSDVYSLFLPIYVETRLDKSEADSLERIKSIFDSKKGICDE